MSFMPRKVWEPGGFGYNLMGGKCNPLPPAIAGVEVDFASKRRHVPWTEIMDRRRGRQAEQLERKRRTELPEILPCYVWTFFNAHDIPYHGWYCYVVTRHFEDAVNFRGFNKPLALSIMRAIPLGLAPARDNFEAWMAAFAQAYPRRRRWPGGKVRSRGQRDPRKSGIYFGWLLNRGIFSLHYPEPVPTNPVIHSSSNPISPPPPPVPKILVEDSNPWSDL